MVDTNILIYAQDRRDGAKRDKAQALIDDLIAKHQFVVSAQVLNELYVNLTHPSKPPHLPPDVAAQVVQAVAGSAMVLPLTGETTLLALEGVVRHQLPFWDALVWATARLHGVPVVYTEDLPSAPVLDGVRYTNPLI